VVRPFLSVLMAGVATAAGVALVAAGGAGSLAQRSDFVPRLDPAPLLMIVGGTVLLAVGAFSLAIHWVGVLVVGAVHAVLGALALLIPFGSPLGGGVFSPVYQITVMFSKVDRWLADGLSVFLFSGASLVVGVFLVAAALGVRSRRLAPPAPTGLAATASVIGGVLLLGAVAVLVLLGGDFVLDLFRTFRYDAVLAVIVVAAGGALAGFGGILLRWSSAGAILASVVVLVVGAVLLVDPFRLGPAFPGWWVGGYGLVLATGATFLGAALAGLVRGPEPVPASVDDL
jgi:hypothetical protein